MSVLEMSEDGDSGLQALERARNVEDEGSKPHPPNVKALAILRALKERQDARAFSDSSKTQEYLREARSGGMYGELDRANAAG